MIDIQKEFERIKKQYDSSKKTEGKRIEDKELENLVKMARTKNIDTDLRNQIIDFVTDVYVEYEQYQEAFNVLNGIIKTSESKNTYLLYMKLAYVKVEAFYYDKKIELKTWPSGIYDNYDGIMNTARNVMANYERRLRNASPELIERLQTLAGKIAYTIEMIDEREDRKNGPKIGNNSKENSPLVEDDLSEDVDKEPAVESVTTVVQDKKIGTDTKGDETVKFEKENVDNPNVDSMLEELEQQLATLSNDVYKYLDVILQIVGLKYDKLSLLDSRIHQLDMEIQQFEKIYQARQRELQLIDGVDKFNEMIQERKRSVEQLNADRSKTNEEFESYKKKANDFFERG